MHEPTEKHPLGALAKPAAVRSGSALERFVADHELGGHVDTARALASEEFQLASRPQVSFSEDPETGEQWVEIALAVRGSCDDVTAAHNRYTRRWVAAAPNEVLPLIRLAYEVG